MKLHDLYSVTPDILPPNLRSYHDRVCAEDRHKVLNSYMTTILEGRPGPGLFWITPTKDGQWVLMLFSEHYRTFDDHESLWREIAAGMTLNHFGKQSDEFKELFDAFPRGRLETGEAIGKWMIGFGGDYPKGWDETKLLERLKVARDDVEIEYDNHWKANDINHQIAMKILRSDG